MIVRSTTRPLRSTLRTASGGAALALLTATLTLAGCGGGGNDSPAAPPPVEQPPATPPPPPPSSISASNQCQAYPTVAASGITGSLVSGVSNPQGRPLTFSVTTQPTRGSVSVAPNGAFSYTTAQKSRGFDDSFTFSVSDGQTTARATYRLIYGKARIMPMGDSITEGVETYTGGDDNGGPVRVQRVGYRYQLQQLLTQNGYDYDFVGRFQYGGSATPPLADPDNEGHGGQTTQYLATSVVTDAFTASVPDVVLLHIGTNDVNNSPATPTATPMQALLTTASAWATANQPVQVVVARIIRFRTGTAGEQRVSQLNTAVTSMINQNFASTTGALKVSQADFESATIAMTQGDDDVTGLHPSRAGYDQMSQVWFNTLVTQKLVNKCD